MRVKAKKKSCAWATEIIIKVNYPLADNTRIGVLSCLLYTSDAADERSSVDLGGRRIIKKKKSRKRRSRDDRLVESLDKC